jgi:hypothetical protein
MQSFCTPFLPDLEGKLCKHIDERPFEAFLRILTMHELTMPNDCYKKFSEPKT